MKLRFLLIPTLFAAAIVFTACPKCKKGDPSPECNPGTIENCTDYTFVDAPSDDFVDNFGDGSFETGWNSYPLEGTIIDDYSSNLMLTLNPLKAIFQELGGPGPISAQKNKCNELAVQGNYAMKLISGKMANMDVFIPGVMGTIDAEFIQQFLSEGGSINLLKPFTLRPTSLKGYYKYSPVQSDSACVEIGVYSNGTQVGSALWKEKREITPWTQFEIPINYTNTTLPITHVKLIFSASAGYNFDDLKNCKGKEGSTLSLDRVWWKL